MQFLLFIAAMILAGIVVGLLLIPLWIVLVLPYSAIAALFDGEAYLTALWKRMKDSAECAYNIGCTIGASIPSP